MNQNSSLKNCLQSTNEVPRARRRVALSPAPKNLRKAPGVKPGVILSLSDSAKKATSFSGMTVLSSDARRKNPGSTSCQLRNLGQVYEHCQTLISHLKNRMALRTPQRGAVRVKCDEVRPEVCGTMRKLPAPRGEAQSP